MSGGHFNYKQYCLEDIASDIEEYLYGRELYEEDIDDYIKEHDWFCDDDKEWIRKNKNTLPNFDDFSEETLALLKEGARKIREAGIYAHRIDWLLSGDDGEDSFKSRLKKDLEKLKTENNDTIRSIEE